MRSITQHKVKSPHLLKTKIHAVELFRKWKNADLVCRRYHISRASLYRWNKRYDGTKESLEDGSHRPLTPHPNAHTEQELKWIKDYHRRNPNISICELYGKLCEDKGYTRNPGSLYRVFVRLGYRKQVESTKKKSKHLGKYDTPEQLGIKWQMDVKYVPTACYSGKDGQKFYQYTMIEEATRERFIYPYMEQSSYSTIDFVKRAIIYFGYAPDTIQTDNGGEFTNKYRKTKGKAPEESCFTLFINKHFKKHKTNPPACPTWDSDVESFHWSIERDCLAWDDIIDNETLIKYTTEYMERYIHTEIKSRGYSPLDKIKTALEIDKINIPKPQLLTV